MTVDPVSTALIQIQRKTGRAVVASGRDAVKAALTAVFEAGKVLGDRSAVVTAMDAVKQHSGREIYSRDLAEVEKEIEALYVAGADAHVEVPTT